jgi:hypothetical protein
MELAPNQHKMEARVRNKEICSLLPFGAEGQSPSYIPYAMTGYETANCAHDAREEYDGRSVM